MKITAIKPFVLDAGIYVKIETDEGIYGLGEGGMKRRGRAIAEVIHSMAPDLIGQDPSRIEHLWQVMFRGNVVMKGYLKAPEQVWSHGPYVTRPTTGPHHAGWVRGA